MIRSPLFFKVMQFLDVTKHHVASSYPKFSDILSFCEHEASAEGYGRLNSHGFIEAVLKIVILAVFQAINGNFLGEFFKGTVFVTKSFKVGFQALSDLNFNFFVLNHVGYSV